MIRLPLILPARSSQMSRRLLLLTAALLAYASTPGAQTSGQPPQRPEQEARAPFRVSVDVGGVLVLCGEILMRRVSGRGAFDRFVITRRRTSAVAALVLNVAAYVWARLIVSPDL